MILTLLAKKPAFAKNRNKILFPDENFAKSCEKLTKIHLSNSSAVHTILQNFYAKAGFFVSFVKTVCEVLNENSENYLGNYNLYPSLPTFPSR
jgi:hypothetical protein